MRALPSTFHQSLRAWTLVIINSSSNGLNIENKRRLARSNIRPWEAVVSEVFQAGPDLKAVYIFPPWCQPSVCITVALHQYLSTQVPFQANQILRRATAGPTFSHTQRRPQTAARLCQKCYTREIMSTIREKSWWTFTSAKYSIKYAMESIHCDVLAG